MWFLTSESDQRVLYILPQKPEVTIGRSPDKEICDFSIQDDASISRKHAVLSINNNGLFVKDLGSRYGTVVNATETLSSNVSVQLHNNSTVKFGKIKSIWKVHEEKLITCTSTLKGENLQNLKVTLTKLGAVLKNDWDETCKYLTMPAITLTIKVVLALVQGSYIVTTQFWSKCLEAIEKYEQLPNPKHYRPDIVESTLNKDIVSFMPDKRRASLFDRKKFVFFSKRQYEMYKAVLINSCATPLLLSECKFTKSMLCEDDVIVIQYNFTTQSQESEMQKNQITEIVNFIKSHGKRVVADPEIGLAILHCSTAKFCNPVFNFCSEVVKQTSAPHTNKVLVQETQDSLGVQAKKENVVINESLLSNNNSTNEGSKRKLNEDNLETNACKKFASDTLSKTNNESSKRKHDEEAEGPSKKMAVDNENDFFNFINTPDSANKPAAVNNKSDKLNLAKPQKRKADFENDEDELFNFVPDKRSNNNEKPNIFEENKTETITNNDNKITAEDISAMRGAKLEELKNANVDWSNNKKIKKEHDDLDDKMNKLDIGEVVVTIKDSLIVKKEPIQIEAKESCLTNFKKFKKVWPLKMQVTVIPKSSMTVLSQNHEELENSVTNNCG